MRELIPLIKENSKSSLVKLVKRLTTKKYIKKLESPISKNNIGIREVEEKQTSTYLKSGESYFKFSMPILDKEGNIVSEAEKGIFWEIYGRYSSSRDLARWIIILMLI